MKRYFHRLLIVLAYVASALVVQADDTEVFITGTTPSGTAAQPNVLFVFDTSGSMDWTITTKIDYDPAGSWGTSDPDYYYLYEQDYDYIRAVHKDHVQCQALKDTIAAQPGNPVFNGRLAYFRPKLWWQWWAQDGWNNISWSSTINSSRPVECEADSGVHGSNASDPNTYAANGSHGPYNSNSSHEINWGSYHRLIAVSAHYHDYLQDPDTSQTRRKTDIMKEAAKDLVDDFDGLNFGLMRFDGNSNGGYAISHFEDITPPANKTAIKAAIDLLPASGGTPLTETLWEAARYYRGDSVDYGSASVAAAKTGSNYNSPMTHSCQKNHLVYLTDGEPYSDSGRDSQIQTLTGKTCSHTEGATLASQTCFDEMAEWMKITDHSSLTDSQDITLHTIGFDINLDLLAVAAQKGGGKVYNASDATELKTAFNSIILSILSTESVFSAPAVTVNAYNNLQHRSDLYYAIFKPVSRPRWSGNIKRYRVTNEAVVLDANSNDAIDELTGFFKDNAQSYWSSDTDGHAVEAGGFSEQLTSTRNIYTYTPSTPPNNALLTDPANLLTVSNTALTNELLGLSLSAPAEEREELIDWMRGEDVEDVAPLSDIHKFVADPLHSRPVVVTYGGTEENPDDTIFAANNMGYLHAISSSNGQEQFAFVPREALDRGILYFQNSATNSDKTYGLDGHIVIWREENLDDADVTVEAAEGDHVYVYVGMRRGGASYYALDVTNRSAPRLMWQIDGGAGDFLDLGQTWSEPKLAKIRWDCSAGTGNCTDRNVLVFTGGFDNVHDTATAETTGDGGAAVFIVDAVTGELLWSAGRPVTPTSIHDLELSDMENSIVDGITLGDIDGDGYIDLMYGVDIMGHVWRFDVADRPETAAEFATGGIVATLGDHDTDTSNDTANLRRFYYAPDVAYFAPRGGKSFLTVSLTSGYRSHPKDTTVTDRVYTIFDHHPFEAPKDEYGVVDYTIFDDSDSDPLDESDLFDATSALADKSTNAPHGWYKTFQGADEKGLSPTTTFGGALVFTTYIPVTPGSTIVCGADIGGGRIYAIDALTGGGVVTDDLGVISEYVELKHSGIPPQPSIIFTDASETFMDPEGNEVTHRKTKPIVCVGTECFGDLLPTDGPLSRTFWRENEG